MATYYYVETEGMVFLRMKNGRLCFPKSVDEMDFELEEEKREMKIEGDLIYFCKPKLTKPPQDWWHKDQIPLLDQADPIVRKAVNLSLPRVIVLGLILDRKETGIEMFMVKPSRGYLTGQWSLPSGFVDYGESPEEAIVREVKEELRLKVSVRSLLLAPSRIVDVSKHFQVWLYYELDFSGEPRPNPDEIESFKWVDIDEVIEDLKKRRPESTLKRALEMVKLRVKEGD